MCLKFSYRKKHGSPPKELRGPLEGRGSPVEKHCFMSTVKELGFKVDIEDWFMLRENKFGLHMPGAYVDIKIK